MRDEDKEIKFRPELAEKLNECLKNAIDFYSINFQKAYYLMLSEVCKDTEPQKSAFLKEVAEYFNKPVFSGEFYEKYKRPLTEYGVEILSNARAAYVVFNVYKDVFDKMELSIKKEGLTKCEQYMVESFFRKLTAPMRNPNIEIKDGQTKCYYDRDYSASFQKDMELSLEYLKKECGQTIELFSIPDTPVLDGDDLEQE